MMGSYTVSRNRLPTVRFQRRDHSSPTAQRAEQGQRWGGGRLRLSKTAQTASARLTSPKCCQLQGTLQTQTQHSPTPHSREVARWGLSKCGVSSRPSSAPTRAAGASMPAERPAYSSTSAQRGWGQGGAGRRVRLGAHLAVSLHCWKALRCDSCPGTTGKKARNAASRLGPLQRIRVFGALLCSPTTHSTGRSWPAGAAGRGRLTGSSPPPPQWPPLPKTWPSTAPGCRRSRPAARGGLGLQLWL